MSDLTAEEEARLRSHLGSFKPPYNDVMIEYILGSGTRHVREIFDASLDGSRDTTMTVLTQKLLTQEEVASREKVQQQLNDDGTAWVPIPKTTAADQSTPGQGQYGDGSTPRTIGNVAPSMEAALLAIGVAERTEGGIVFADGMLEEYVTKINEFAESIDLPNPGFGVSNFKEANQWVQELGEPRRRQFLYESFDTYGDSLDVVMHDGTHRIVGFSELSSLAATVDADHADIAAAVQASVGGGKSFPFHLTLLAHYEREKAGIAGSVFDTARLVREGMELYGDRDLFGYLHAAEAMAGTAPGEEQTAREKEEARTDPRITLAETMFTSPESMTDAQAKLRDDLLGPYKAVADSSSDFNPNMLDYQTMGLLEVSDRTPDAQQDEATVRQKFRELHAALFAENPDEETLNAMQARFEGDLVAWADKPPAVMPSWMDEPVGDIYARPTAESSGRGFIQSTDLYQDLFDDAFEESGLTDTAYAGRFQHEASRFADPTLQRTAARAGMRSGDVSDVGEYAMTKAGAADRGSKSGLAQIAAIMRDF